MGKFDPVFTRRINIFAGYHSIEDPGPGTDSRASLPGTEWMITGSAYAAALDKFGLQRLISGHSIRERLNDAIFWTL